MKIIKLNEEAKTHSAVTPENENLTNFLAFRVDKDIEKLAVYNDFAIAPFKVIQQYIDLQKAQEDINNLNSEASAASELCFTVLSLSNTFNQIDEESAQSTRTNTLFALILYICNKYKSVKDYLNYISTLITDYTNKLSNEQLTSFFALANIKVGNDNALQNNIEDIKGLLNKYCRISGDENGIELAYDFDAAEIDNTTTDLVEVQLKSAITNVVNILDLLCNAAKPRINLANCAVLFKLIAEKIAKSLELNLKDISNLDYYNQTLANAELITKANQDERRQTGELIDDQKARDEINAAKCEAIENELLGRKYTDIATDIISYIKTLIRLLIAKFELSLLESLVSTGESNRKSDRYKRTISWNKTLFSAQFLQLLVLKETNNQINLSTEADLFDALKRYLNGDETLEDENTNEKQYLNNNVTESYLIEKYRDDIKLTSDVFDKIFTNIISLLNIRAISPEDALEYFKDELVSEDLTSFADLYSNKCKINVLDNHNFLYCISVIPNKLPDKLAELFIDNFDIGAANSSGQEITDNKNPAWDLSNYIENKIVKLEANLTDGAASHHILENMRWIQNESIFNTKKRSVNEIIFAVNWLYVVSAKSERATRAFYFKHYSDKDKVGPELFLNRKTDDLATGQFIPSDYRGLKSKVLTTFYSVLDNAGVIKILKKLQSARKRAGKEAYSANDVIAKAFAAIASEYNKYLLRKKDEKAYISTVVEKFVTQCCISKVYEFLLNKPIFKNVKELEEYLENNSAAKVLREDKAKIVKSIIKFSDKNNSATSIKVYSLTNPNNSNATINLFKTLGQFVTKQ